jgi:hypothetical protein
VSPQRPESREETPKEGICGRSMPHRNNIHFRSIKCKIFLRPHIEIAASATFLPQYGAARFAQSWKFPMSNNGLHALYSLARRRWPTTRHG